MKRVLLKNKKTGAIGELSGVNRIVVYEPDMPLCGNSILGEYATLAELNKEWEDYKLVEPLIKDPKIRKAVKAMADITGVSMLYYEYYEWSKTVQLSDMNGQTLIFKSKRLSVKALESYTIRELIGDEE